MTRFRVTVLINTTHGSRFNRYELDAVLAYEPAFAFCVEADDVDSAAEKAYAIGNRQAVDTLRRSWPSSVTAAREQIVATAAARRARLLPHPDRGWRNQVRRADGRRREGRASRRVSHAAHAESMTTNRTDEPSAG